MPINYLADVFISHWSQNMEKVIFQVSRTAHVYTLGEPGPHIRHMWLCCHGYAQTAAEFMEDLDVLKDPNTLVVAPEGMNYFYKKGFAGPVGANWMTRHFREDAIADNAAYLQQVLEHYLAMVPADVTISLLGFSQGTATLCRWILGRHPHFHNLVLWAGLPPEDLSYQDNRDYLADKKLYLLYGTNDPFLTADRMNDLQQLESDAGVDFGLQSFSGGHEIPEAVLSNLKGEIG